ncbi:MAG: ATP-binding cassette domain-containing protein [Clostridium sp.]
MMKYQIHKGSKYYGATTVFENIQFEIRNTEKIAIVGRNGCGKTTLLKIIAESESLTAGKSIRKPVEHRLSGTDNLRERDCPC